MNAVRDRERQRVARHEAAHAAAAYFFNVAVHDVEIVDAPETGGYTTGSCAWTLDPKINVLVTAVGVLDGHGIRGPNEEGDAYELERLVPDPDARAEVLALAERVMAHPEFVRVRNALWRRLTFADQMGHDEIAKIATAAAGRVSA